MTANLVNYKNEKQVVSNRLYLLVDRLKKHSEWKYPDAVWDDAWYSDVALAWKSKEDELEKRVIQLEIEMNLSNKRKFAKALKVSLPT